MSASLTRMTIRLPQSVRDRLKGLAQSTDRAEASLAVDAISSYVELQEWQIKQIKAGLREADAGDFADDDEVAAVFARWTNAR
jgi:RHH-type rel operon transcriptional repressor/antitoxin RelB